MANEELAPSELGTKEYWDNHYALEKGNFDETKDEGEIWFGESSMRRVVKWLEQNVEDKNDCSIVDIGCGNGLMSMELHETGFRNLSAIDYSEAAIVLSRKIAEERQINGIDYQTCDIVNLPEDFHDKFDVCIDKGTYDAISLHPEHAKVMRQGYKNGLVKMFKQSTKFGYFIITSCNWTESELRSDFESLGLTVLKVLPTKQFQFGGATGNNVTAIVFKKS